MKIVSETKSHGGIQGVYSHWSTTCNCDMTFAVFVPHQASVGKRPVLWFLSGLTCTHANVMEKGEYRRLASELGLIVVCPDTSPRGDAVPDEKENWQFGHGAGFYLDATQPPFDLNYRMYSYITAELPALIEQNFRADTSRQGIFGHSMGGHGALTIALKNPDRFHSCSALHLSSSHRRPGGRSRPSISIWARIPKPGERMMRWHLLKMDIVSPRFWSTRAAQTASLTMAFVLGSWKVLASREASS